MPVEIRELHIKVVVTEGNQPAGGAGGAGAPEAANPAGGEGREALIAECVEQVMHILRQREER